jgi:hypothetical protein
LIEKFSLNDSEDDEESDDSDDDRAKEEKCDTEQVKKAVKEEFRDLKDQFIDHYNYHIGATCHNNAKFFFSGKKDSGVRKVDYDLEKIKEELVSGIIRVLRDRKIYEETLKLRDGMNLKN